MENDEGAVYFSDSPLPMVLILRIFQLRCARSDPGRSVSDSFVNLTTLPIYNRHVNLVEEPGENSSDGFVAINRNTGRVDNACQVNAPG